MCLNLTVDSKVFKYLYTNDLAVNGNSNIMGFFNSIFSNMGFHFDFLSVARDIIDQLT